MQAHSPELHRNKSLTVFFLRCGKVGGLLGMCRRHRPVAEACSQ